MSTASATRRTPTSTSWHVKHDSQSHMPSPTGATPGMPHLSILKGFGLRNANCNFPVTVTIEAGTDPVASLYAGVTEPDDALGCSGSAIRSNSR